MIKTLRDFPAVEELIQDKCIKIWNDKLPRPIIADIVKSVVAESKQDFQSRSGLFSRTDLLEKITKKLVEFRNGRLGRVINGTGTLIHTNLGRAPLSDSILNNISNSISGYSNLEFDLSSGKRGQRGVICEQYLARLSEAESATVVNNCAAALFIIANTFSNRRRIVISRGELVQIGGGFRIQDILKRAGAKLAEVGSTNITSIDDYKNALDKSATMMLKVHKSNFTQSGFTSEVELKELVSLGRKTDTLVVNDLGSGGFVPLKPIIGYNEPTVQQSVRAGADLTCFSGDKLIGGVQAGLIVGRADLIAKIKKNPLFRTMRVDKIVFAALESLLKSFLDGSYADDIPLWKMMHVPESELYKRAKKLVKNLGKPSTISVAGSTANIGGGAVPEAKIPSVSLVFSSNLSATRLMRKFRACETPIIGRIENDCFMIDLKAIEADDLPYLTESVKAILSVISSESAK